MSRHPQTTPPLTWLTSFPRSGNTFLRTILRHQFGLHSSSMYPDDLDGNRELGELIGDIPREEGGPLPFAAQGPRIVKTHEALNSIGAQDRTLYVIRDGRAAIVSLYEYYRHPMPLEQLIKGGHQFGLWAGHYRSWKPVLQNNALLIRYEDLVADRQAQVRRLADFLDVEPISDKIPDRNSMANVDGRFIRRPTPWQSVLQGEALALFNAWNHDVLTEFGYI